jgi:NADH-quinone oxidoreductase subunit N
MFPNRSLIDALQADLARDLLAFLPETMVCGTVVLLLLARLFGVHRRMHLGWLALGLTVAALAASLAQWGGDPSLDPRATEPGSPAALPLFTGLLSYDSFTLFFRVFLLAFTALTLGLSLLTGIPDRDDASDFGTLLLGAALGMMLMASANHLLMVFIAVEMASLPSYALAGFLKGRRQGSEAALKYVVYGASASGVMLYGISLLAGKFGTGYLPDLAVGYAAVLRAGPGFDPVLLMGTLFVLIGLGFKLAAVPFHFWCPDVFEGAAAEVAAFLSVASKGAAMALTARFLAALQAPFGPGDLTLPGTIGAALAVFAGLTATFGNLAAYAQTNVKRLLAYSTIAHAGYMLMGLAPMTAAGNSAVLYYLVAYLLMNLGAFAVVAFLRNRTGSEDLADWRGLVRREPVLVVTLALFLLSLLGMPPLAGFAAKFGVFAALYDAGLAYNRAGAGGLGDGFYALLAVGALNTVFSAFYYLKVLRVTILDDAPDAVRAAAPARPGPAVYATVLAGGLVVALLAWNPLADAGDRAVAAFRPAPTAAASLPRPEVAP